MKKRAFKYNYSNHLFPKTSFLIGLGSALNVCGNYYLFNYSKSEEAADHKAISCDWYATGKDLFDAIEGEKRENHLAEFAD